MVKKNQKKIQPKEMPWKKEIEDQKKEIEALKNHVNLLTTTVHTLEHDILIVNQKLEISSHVNNVLRLQLDDLQQYTRRLFNSPGQCRKETQRKNGRRRIRSKKNTGSGL